MLECRLGWLLVSLLSGVSGGVVCFEGDGFPRLGDSGGLPIPVTWIGTMR